ncbi:MAG: uroporphyrinogen-III synthase [Planctomycetes bacterium]|nr:uroporphyrinogen-III synthase [Planctomycetota bacterium]
MKRILITGPVETLDDYAAAARGAGWTAIECPLITIEPLAPAFERAELERADVALVTSSHALPALVRAFEASPTLRARPLHLVGARTAARARELGLAPRLVATDAHELARLVLALEPRPARAFWPRGNLSDELARALRAAGVDVLDPIVYATREAAASTPAPAADAVFFASPSAVRSWRALDGARAHPARTAIAIGATTLEALHAETGACFRDILSLPRASSRELALLLAHLDLTP